MRKACILLLFLGVVCNLSARDKKSHTQIAKAFCGGNAKILARNAGGFMVKCSRDQTLLSGVLDDGVLYTVYPERKTSHLARAVEVLEPKSERWQTYVEGYQNYLNSKKNSRRFLPRLRK